MIFKRAATAGCIMTGQPIDGLIDSLAVLLNELLNDSLPETEELVENPNEGKRLPPLVEKALQETEKSFENLNEGKRLPPLVGKSYKLISKKAQKEKHSVWKKHMNPVESKVTMDVI